MGGVSIVSTSSRNSGESPDGASPPASPDSPATGSGIWSVFVSPARAFAGLRNRPQWFGPLIIAGAATALAQGWLVQAVGMQHVIATALRNSGSIDTVATVRNLTSNAAAVLTGQALAAVLGCFIAAVAMSCVLWLSAVVVGEQMRFRSLLSVVALAVFAYSVTRACMLVGTVGLAAHPERLNIKDPLATSVGYFVGPQTSGWMALYGSLDVLSIGAVLLLIQGLRIVGGLSWRRSVLAVGIPWVAYLLRGFIVAMV